MDTLVDAGLAPDTSKWKYPPSSNVREIRWMTPCVCVFFFACQRAGGEGEREGWRHTRVHKEQQGKRKGDEVVVILLVWLFRGREKQARTAPPAFL